MAVQRNVEGLRQNARKKRQEALEKVEQGIRQLLKEGRTVNFNTVAQAANVSKAFLYKELEIKERIELLRQQGTKKAPEFKQRASDASKDAIIRNLRERVKKLEAEVKGLRKQNEVAYGQVIEVNSLRQQVGRLQAESDRLRQPESLRTSDLEDKAMALGVQLNSTVRRIIQDAPQAVIEKSIDSLREAISANRANNPSGFFYKAVTDAWQPNENYQNKAKVEEFNNWWKEAHSKGIVVASTEIEGVQHVLTKDGKWQPFQEVATIHPLPFSHD